MSLAWNPLSRPQLFIDEGLEGGVQLHFHQLSLFECMCESINFVIKGHHKVCGRVNERSITPSLQQLAQHSTCCLS